MNNHRLGNNGLADTLRSERSRCSNPFTAQAHSPVQDELLKILRLQKSKRLIINDNKNNINAPPKPKTRIEESPKCDWSPKRKTSNNPQPEPQLNKTARCQTTTSQAYPESSSSILQGTLKLLKARAEERCPIKDHEGSRTQYLCLSPQCKCASRIGCAHCFLSLHQGHEKSRTEDFLKQYTGDYLRYLGNFDEFLKQMRAAKRREQEALKQEINHIKKLFLLQLDKFEKSLYHQIRSHLAAELDQEYKALEKSLKTIALIHNLEEQQQYSARGAPNSRTAEAGLNKKISTLVEADLPQVNEMVSHALSRMQKRNTPPLLASAQYEQKLNQVTAKISQSVFNSHPSHSYNTPRHAPSFRHNPQEQAQNYSPRDSVDYVEEISVSKLRSVKRYSPDRTKQQQEEEISFTKTVQNRSLLHNCPRTNKQFLTCRMNQVPAEILEGIDFVNTLSLFSCCGNKYCCSQCHNKYEDHESQETGKLTWRSCMMCGEVFQVPYGVSVGINCKCTKKTNPQNVLIAKN